MTEARRWNSAAAYLAILVATLATTMTAQTVMIFDVPGATYTRPVAINNNGDVAGSYYSPNQSGGFVRDFRGHITTFDLHPTAINDAGTVTGTTGDSLGTEGFIREKKGNVTLFRLPDWGVPGMPFSRGGTSAISNSGEVAGFYFGCFRCDDANGFFWDGNGGLTTFSAAGATSINARGDITGFTGPYSIRGTGFIRDRSGNVTWFNVPYPYLCSYPTGAAMSINNNGDVTGYYGNCYGFAGFIRWRDGDFSVFDGMPVSINESGDVVGNNYPDGTGVLHNFVRDKQGNITLFDGGTPVGINNRDDVTGYFSDTTGTHGFVRTPH